MWCKEVVGIDKSDPLALCLGHAEVARGTDATVRLVDDMETTVAGSIFIADGGRGAFAPVVNEQRFEVFVMNHLTKKELKVSPLSSFRFNLLNLIIMLNVYCGLQNT